jgi:hypothetical protein
MVSSRIVSQFIGELPKSDRDRKIKGQKGPLYDPAVVIGILDKGRLIPWSTGCRRDMQKWEYDQKDVEDLAKYAVSFGQYIDSEWCQSKAEGPWAACDAYRFTRREWNDAAYKEMDCEYYIKIAIGKTGQVLFLVSCHPSGS